MDGHRNLLSKNTIVVGIKCLFTDVNFDTDSHTYYHFSLMLQLKGPVGNLTGKRIETEKIRERFGNFLLIHEICIILLKYLIYNISR